MAKDGEGEGSPTQISIGSKDYRKDREKKQIGFDPSHPASSKLQKMLKYCGEEAALRKLKSLLCTQSFICYHDVPAHELRHIFYCVVDLIL